MNDKILRHTLRGCSLILTEFHSSRNGKKQIGVMCIDIISVDLIDQPNVGGEI